MYFSGDKGGAVVTGASALLVHIPQMNW